MSKREKPEPDFNKAELAKFTKAVVALHDHRIYGEPPNRELLLEVEHRQNEVKHVAVGLITLRQLADRELDRLLATEDGLHRLGRTGLRQAIALLDALTTGNAHPVHYHLGGLSSKAFRQGRKRPDIITKMDNDGLAGLVRAYQKAMKKAGQTIPESVAIRRVMEACNVDGFEFLVPNRPRNNPTGRRNDPPTVAERIERHIRDWNARAKDGRPDKIAADLLRKAQQKQSHISLPERLLEIGRQWAEQTFSLPKLTR
jgi:hypothetical protein